MNQSRGEAGVPPSVFAKFVALMTMLVMPAQAAMEVMRLGAMDRSGTRSRNAGRFLRLRPLRRNLLI